MHSNFIKLSNIVELYNGYAFKSNDYIEKSNTLNCRMSNIRPNGQFDILYNAKYLPDKYAIDYRNYILKDGDLIIAMTDMAGDPKILGIPTVVNTLGYNLLLNQRVGKLVIYNKSYTEKYLKYALSCRRIRDYFKSFAGGGVQLNVGKKEILNAEISDYPLEKQKEIVSTLDKLQSIITHLRTQLEKLDLLVKARFVEMFGDPQKNTQNRPTTELINVVKMQRGFDLPTYSRNQNGNVPVYGANGALDKHDTAKVFGGGVITGRSGTIGNVYYTLDDYWPLNTSLFSSDLHGNNVIYLAYLLDMFDLTRFKEGTGVPTLNRNKFHKEQIIDVPIIQQTQFADFVKQVDQSKSILQQELEKAQTLFDSLMQEYFG